MPRRATPAPAPAAEPAYDYLPAALRRRFREVGRQDRPDAVVVAHYFLPGTGWDWWAMDLSEDGGREHMFCLVRGLETELGSVSLDELRELRHPRLGLPVERDLHFRETTLDALRRSLRERGEG